MTAAVTDLGDTWCCRTCRDLAALAGEGWLGEPENAYDESADREEYLADWPDGEVPG